MLENAKALHRVGKPRVNVAQQRVKYGGFNIGAAFYGWLVAVGVGVIITSILAAAGTVLALTATSASVSTKDVTEHATTIGLAGGILLLAAGAISYYMGGYVAGRMSRFDGARQGFGVWVMGILTVVLLAAIGAGFGAKYNIYQQLNLPRIPVSEGDLSTSGLITLLLSLLVTLVAAVAGGSAGIHYHRKVDRAGIDTVG